jgi:glycosidase
MDIVSEQSLAEIDWAALTGSIFHPSPAAWEDEVFYFLLLDRFSNGREQGYRGNDGEIVVGGDTPLFKPSDAGNAIRTEDEARRWRESGGRWAGGTLQGLTSKLGYLHRLGVTAVWVSPVFKQVAFEDSYHGYGVQDFLDVDPHFGTREDLRAMVQAAHALGIRVVLDIILNHAGNVFRYRPDRYWTQRPGMGEQFLDPRWDGNLYEVEGFHDAHGNATLPFGRLEGAYREAARPNGAIWPEEFQDTEIFTRKGHISNWDYDPEFREGDFASLKDIALGCGLTDDYQPSAALLALCKVYKFWMAFTDADGYRVDTVKHMDPGAARFFAANLHEFAQRLGKENFYLIAEVAGGRERAVDTLETTGLDAALAIADEPGKLEALVKGYVDPAGYFGLFRNSLQVGKESHVWFRNKVVTTVDDHDQIRKGGAKARFCAGDQASSRLALACLALNVTTLGIPCIYYGSEQLFDGAGDNDRYIREAMFGGEFGAFRSRGRHCFDEDGPTYQEVAKILAIRKEKIALRRGRQYLREISDEADGYNFGLPAVIGGRMRSIVPWSRLFDDHETLLAINTDPDRPRTAWVLVDNDLQQGAKMRCLYSTDTTEIGQELEPERKERGKAVRLTVPAAGFVIYE